MKKNDGILREKANYFLLHLLLSFLCSLFLQSILTQKAYAESTNSLLHTEQLFAICMQKCESIINLGEFTKNGCIEACYEARRSFPVRGKNFDDVQECVQDINKIELQRDTILHAKEEWCDREFSSVRKRRGCKEGMRSFYLAVTTEFLCNRDAFVIVEEVVPLQQNTTPKQRTESLTRGKKLSSTKNKGEIVAQTKRSIENPNILIPAPSQHSSSQKVRSGAPTQEMHKSINNKAGQKIQTPIVRHEDNNKKGNKVKQTLDSKDKKTTQNPAQKTSSSKTKGKKRNTNKSDKMSKKIVTTTGKSTTSARQQEAANGQAPAGTSLGSTASPSLQSPAQGASSPNITTPAQAVTEKKPSAASATQLTPQAPQSTTQNAQTVNQAKSSTEHSSQTALHSSQATEESTQKSPNSSTELLPANAAGKTKSSVQTSATGQQLTSKDSSAAMTNSTSAPDVGNNQINKREDATPAQSQGSAVDKVGTKEQGDNLPSILPPIQLKEK